jgi:RNA polymerase sigma factor (sigma-70 family)
VNHERHPSAKPPLRPDAERNALAAKNIGLVGGVLRRRFGGRDGAVVLRCGGWDDAFQAGCLGLLRAAELFDELQGKKFSTYAEWWIVRAVQHCASRQCGAMTVPHRLGARHPDKVPPEAKAAMQPVVSVEAAGESGRRPEDKRPPDVNGLLDLRDAMACLTRREKSLVRLHFRDGKTYVQIGKRYGLSRERIRQLMKAMLEKLRDRLA